VPAAAAPSPAPGRERHPARHRHLRGGRGAAHRSPHGRPADAHQRGEPVRSRRAPRPGVGVGLANVRRRLLASYGDHARVVAERGEESFRVAISMPAEAAE
jgi:hypothetical protein